MHDSGREALDVRAGAAALNELTRVIGRAWRIVRVVLVTALLVAGGVILLELLHLHALLSSIHPWLAHGVLGALALAVLAVVARFAWTWWRLPGVLTPPELPPDAGAWTGPDAVAHARFAQRYLSRQAGNRAMSDEDLARVADARAALRRLAEQPHCRERAAAIDTLIDDVMEPLDRRARREIWRSATEVAVLTAVNPSAMLDVLITLLRNLELAARIATLYYGRPGLLGTARVVRDVLAVAATAGVLDRVVDGASSVAADMAGSWTARFAGPVGQGLVNGLLTVRLGDAAVARCRSLRSRRVAIRPWDLAMWREMASRLASAAGSRVGPSLSRAFRAAAGDGAAARTARAFRSMVVGERRASTLDLTITESE